MNSVEKEAVLHCLKVTIDEALCEDCPLYGTTGTYLCEKDCARLAINALSSSEKPNKSEIQTGWIACSERLPEKAGRYLCVVGAKYRNPREMYYAPQKWANKSDKATWRSIDGAYVYDWFVKAWMPLPELPEPYKASSTGWIPVSVIKDIKSEINELSELDHIEPTYEDCKRDVLEILDKYKASPTGEVVKE